MERCPVCKAACGDKERCHRCKCDLQPFTAIEVRSRQLLSMAVGALKQGDYSAAFAHAERSCRLKYSKQARQLRFYAAELGRL